MYPAVLLTYFISAAVILLASLALITKRYATKATDRHNVTSLFSISRRGMIVTRIVMSIPFMFKAILMKIHSWEEGKTQYLLTDFAAITALLLTYKSQR